MWDIRRLGLGILLSAGLLALAACDSAEDRAQSHYQRGLELVKEGDPVKASLEFRNALQLKDDHVPAMYALAEIEEGQGKLESAVGLYRNIVERDQKHVEARVHLARILLLGGQVDAALKLADEAYAIDPKPAAVLALKGAVALALDNRKDAVRYADDALKVEPDHLDALMLKAAERMKGGDAGGAMEFLDAAEAKDEKNLAVQLFRLTALEALKDDEGVEKVFQKLVAFYPNDPRFRDGLARWYITEGRKDDAEKALRKFAADNPDNVEAQLVVVEYLGREKGVEAAKAELEALIAKGGNAFPFKTALAQVALGTGDYDGAVAILTKLVDETTDPTNKSAAKVLLARMMAGKQDWAGAGKLVDEVIAADAKHVDALTVRAAIRVQNGKVDDAIADLREAINAAPQNTRVLLVMADAYERKGDTVLAEEQYAKALKNEKFQPGVALPYVQFLLRYGKAEQAERVLTEARGVAPGNREVLTLLAQIKVNKQDWAAAQDIAETLKKLGDAGSDATANQILAASLGAQQQYDQSIDLLKSTAAAKPGDVSPMAALVSAYVRSGKPELADEFLAKVLKDDPDNAAALVLSGSLAAFRQKPQDAEAFFKQAVEKDPNSPLGYQSLARFYLQTGRTDEAEKTARAGLEKQKDDPALRLVLGSLYEMGGKTEEAIAEYEAMFAADPLSVIAANNLASLLAEYREDQASVDRANQIATRFRDSNIPQFLDTLGWTYYRKGDYAQALALLRGAVEKLPDVAMVQYHLGMAYKALDQKDLAVASLEKAVALGKAQSFPKAAEAEKALAELSAAAAPVKTN